MRATEILLYQWRGDNVVFLSDDGEDQDTFYAIRTGSVATYGHAFSHGPDVVCQCHLYTEVA
jgi:hypothetical protein